MALAKELGKGGKVVILEGNPEADNAKELWALTMPWPKAV